MKFCKIHLFFVVAVMVMPMVTFAGTPGSPWQVSDLQLKVTESEYRGGYLSLNWLSDQECHGSVKNLNVLRPNAENWRK